MLVTASFAAPTQVGTTNIYFELIGEGDDLTLTISGKGDMPDFYYYEYPWYFFRHSIKNIVIENDVTSIGFQAFNYCDLTSVVIGNSVKSIGSGAFAECTNLSSVTIPNSVTSIGQAAFGYCSGLTSIIVPNSITNIGNYAFNNSGLITITIPNSITSIGDGTFSACHSLTSVTIPTSVTSIEPYAFAYCENLASVILPNTITSIEYCAFYNSGLTTINIPNSVTNIADYAFTGCHSLTSVSIGNSLTNIGLEAFAICDQLTSITVDVANATFSAENNVLFNKDKTTLILYPGGIAGEYVMPNSVTSIRERVFDYCENLKSVTNLSITPIVITPDVFFDNQLNRILSVPTSSEEAYQAADVWNKFTIVGGGLVAGARPNNNLYGYVSGVESRFYDHRLIRTYSIIRPSQ
ncbi:hypothetical protein FACS1894176_06950 [Bacteroidia bacterium]|nr:hypothetical protein FACS1894176_06950 [Bacteroidia bacterium]